MSKILLAVVAGLLFACSHQPPLSKDDRRPAQYGADSQFANLSVKELLFPGDILVFTQPIQLRNLVSFTRAVSYRWEVKVPGAAESFLGGASCEIMLQTPGGSMIQISSGSSFSVLTEGGSAVPGMGALAIRSQKNKNVEGIIRCSVAADGMIPIALVEQSGMIRVSPTGDRSVRVIRASGEGQETPALRAIEI